MNGGAMSYQIGGNHYTRCAIQPFEYIRRNGLDYWEGNIVKYMSRHKDKNGLEDVLKAKHYIEYIIEHYDELYMRGGKE